MKKFLLILLILGCAVPVFAKKRVEETIITPVTQLEKRSYQTRVYGVDEKIAVMKALLNTLQDEGFIVNNVNSLLGFIYGVKDFDTSDSNIDISKEFGFTKSRLNYNGVKVATVEFAANVTEYGDNVRTRVNFKRKLLNEYGNAQFIDDIDDSEFYDEFYKKVENNLNLSRAAQPAPVTKPAVQIINEVLPVSVRVKEPEQNAEIADIQEKAAESEKIEANEPINIEPEKTEAPQTIEPAQAEEIQVQDETAEEKIEPAISNKEFKQQAKLEKQMLKEIEKQQKIQEKLREKEEAGTKVKVIKELNKGAAD